MAHRAVRGGPGGVLGIATAAFLCTGCSGGGGSPSSGSASPSSRPHAGPASDYLLRLDELALPGFTGASPSQAADQTGLSAGDATLAAALASAGIRSAASARYFRAVPTLRTATGPIDVATTVIECSGSPAATALFSALNAHLDAVSGAIPVSTGALGDAGHGDVIEVTDQGVTVAQVTLTWRTRDLVSMLVVRERNTGSPLQDALIVAQPEVTREQG